MSNVFQPQVAQVNSAVTPQQGVVDTTAVDLFADVAQAATDATFAFTGQRELSELKGKFDKIVQARQAGGNSAALQVKARADLDVARANAPWIAQEADRLFKDTFGGGSSTGVFAATPEEKARDAHLKKVEETRLALGLSTSEEAQKRITLDENAKMAKVQADTQKEVREYNGDVVFSNTQTQLNNNSVKFVDAINRVMTQSGGTIRNEDVRSLNLTVDQQALTLKQQLNSQTRDPETGHLLISKASYDDNLKEIEDWVSDTKAMVGDQSFLKVIQDLNTEQSAEINLLATNKYKTLKILDASGGQAAVNAYLVAAKRPEGAAKQLLIGANPIANDMFKQPGSFQQAGSAGFDKIVLPTPEVVSLSEPEAMATGTMINDPANAKLMVSTVEQVATDESAVEPFKSMINKNTDSSAVMWSNMFKSWSAANQDKGKTVLDHGLGALKTSFLSAYVSENGKLPVEFNIVNETGTTRVKTKGGFKEKRKVGKGSFRPNVVKGEGISRESGRILSNMLSTLKQNPKYSKQLASEMGVPDASPQELVKFIVLGTPKEIDESLGFTEDDISFMIGSGKITEDDATLFRSRGLVQGSSAQSDTNTPATDEDSLQALPEAPEATFNALEDSSPKEIAKFQKALSAAKTATEKAEVHAAFVDGQFREAQ